MSKQVSKQAKVIVANKLVEDNPDCSINELGQKMVELGLYDHAGSIRHMLPEIEAKQALKHFTHNEILPVAYRIHSDKLKSIAKKEAEAVDDDDHKWVTSAEKMADTQVNVDVTRKSLDIQAAFNLYKDIDGNRPKSKRSKRKPHKM